MRIIGNTSLINQIFYFLQNINTLQTQIKILIDRIIFLQFQRNWKAQT